VFGPQTLHRLPQLIAARAAPGRPQVDTSFPEIEKFDALPPAGVTAAQAFVSIMEGCSKYCTFCIVPYTRGEESRARWTTCWPKSPDWRRRACGSDPARPERERLPRPMADGEMRRLRLPARVRA
jgi:hypothetical protein